ncbi:endonuclease domain of the non-LTR retrotransposon LINE-1 [Elysia marginata]|uniref:Endonuclease domain of the non-LTR retrotransposon LINE-1 n=1 Tax=Elysia marginata TaxID=1093978 RepID=A0AAV4ENY2_9GAST|nr:endonuclease domain of the non-LTR retrotransposon LINE-1 [Elysia marginata]
MLSTSFVQKWTKVTVGSGFAPWLRGRGFETQPSTVRAPTGWVGVSIIETWFQESASDSSFDIDNFCLKRSDRTKASNKSRGGGTCLYVNEKWCYPNNVHVKQQLCTPDLEMLTVVLRPFYPHREFTKVTVNVVYVHPKANTIAAMSTVSTNHVHEQQNQSPDGVILVTPGRLPGTSTPPTLKTISLTTNNMWTCQQEGIKL